VERLSADELESLDVVAENIARLRDLFPEAFTEDGIDFGVLRDLLGDEVADGDEKFGLNWHGKRLARQIALTPSTGTLRPCPDDSVDWESTQNLMIEGDNLEVLKLLQKSYGGKVKLIYIDPPYNTGPRPDLQRRLPGQPRQLSRSHRPSRRRIQSDQQPRVVRTVPHPLAQHDVSPAQARTQPSLRRRHDLRVYR
jgi:adenine-specific DNA-methyltransferase